MTFTSVILTFFFSAPAAFQWEPEKRNPAAVAAGVPRKSRPGKRGSDTARILSLYLGWLQFELLRTVQATRYVTPLREGGSLPAIVEADDCGLYVLKFRGAGQGPLALVAELVSGEVGRALGINVPELVLMEVDESLGRNEPDYEIREL